MQINYTKTKEMVLGRLTSNPPPLLNHRPDTVQPLSQFKLLGVAVSFDLQWDRGPHWLHLFKANNYFTD